MVHFYKVCISETQYYINVTVSEGFGEKGCGGVGEPGGGY